MDKDYYITKINELLNNQQYYQPIDTNIDNITISKIIKLCTKHNNILKRKEKDFLTNFIIKTNNLYGLPKIHKSEQIKYAISTQNSEYIQIHNPDDLKFRPIVAGPACPTSRLSNLIDILLQPFTNLIKSYIKDSTHFLKSLPNTVENETLITTFDVSSLYSNIPHDLGKKAISYWINKHTETLHPRFTEEFIIESIDIILNNNSFQFNNNNYIQTLGTAMGTKMAPTYATLTLAYLEETLYDRIEEIFDTNTKDTFIKSWKRYLDDCFILWRPTWGNIKNLESILQNLHPKIKFTMEQSKTELPFLDILVKIKNNNIITDIYHKPTDTQQYLHFKSHHPKSCLKSIPYSLARRICTIVTDEHLQTTRLKELQTNLIMRKYPLQLINKGIELAQNIPIEHLRTSKKQNKNQLLAYVSTHNINNPELFTEITKNLTILNQNNKLKNFLKNTKIIKSKRQPNNLKKMLTSSKLNKPNIQGVTKCNKQKCGVCDIILEGKTYTFTNPHRTFKIKNNLNCTSKNVIYVLQCELCKESYIGATKNLTHRTALHKSNIKITENRKLHVSKHIHTCSGGKFKIQPLYQNSDYSYLLDQEKNFIAKFKPTLNKFQ